MSNDNHFSILRNGVEHWNRWRKENPQETPNLANAFLMGATGTMRGGAKAGKRVLKKGDRTPMQGIDLRGAMLANATMEFVILHGADLTGANLDGANLKRASLRGVKLDGAFMQDVNLRSANLTNASLRGVDLRRAILVETDFSGADLTDCNVFGVGAWNVKLSDTTKQSRLVVQDYNAPALVVPGLALAQFVYILQQDTGLRDVLQAMINNGVLLLGRFTPERKDVLDALAENLAGKGLVPLMFDFAPLPDRNLVETVIVLAGLSRFIIADLTEAKAVGFELTKINDALKVPTLLTLADSEDVNAATEMWDDISENHWVSHQVTQYAEVADLLAQVPAMISEADQIRQDLRETRQARRLVPRTTTGASPAP